MLLLQKTLKEARENGGRISRDEISEIFSGLSLDRSQLEQVEGYLKAHKIVVGTQAGDVDALPEVERDFLTSYMEMLDNIPELSDSVLEALKISAMAGEHSAQKELSEQTLAVAVIVYVGRVDLLVYRRLGFVQEISEYTSLRRYPEDILHEYPYQ